MLASRNDDSSHGRRNLYGNSSAPIASGTAPASKWSRLGSLSVSSLYPVRTRMPWIANGATRPRWPGPGTTTTLSRGSISSISPGPPGSRSSRPLPTSRQLQFLPKVNQGGALFYFYSILLASRVGMRPWQDGLGPSPQRIEAPGPSHPAEQPHRLRSPHSATHLCMYA